MNRRLLPVACALLAFIAPHFVANAQVVINEIHYHPVEDANFDAAGNPVFFGTTTPADFTEDVHEFIEIYNAGASPVDVAGWKLTGGINFVFPASQTIAPGGFVVVAKNPARLAAVYGLDPATILGPYTGQLSNRAETLRLRDSADLGVDSVSYSSEFPWAISADGLGADDRFTLLNSSDYRYKGRSLERVSVSSSSNDPANWLASPLASGPSPGSANSVSRSAPQPVVISYSAAQDSDGAVLIRAAQPVRLQCAFSSTAALSGVEVEYFIDSVNSFAEGRNTVAMTDLGNGLFVATLPGQADRSVVRFRIKANRGDGLEVVSPRADDPAIVPVGASLREGWHAYFVTPNRNSTKPIYECFVANADLAVLNSNITQSPKRVTTDHPNALPRDTPYLPPNAPLWNGTKPAIFVSNGVVRDAQIRYHGSRYNRSAGRNSFKLLFPDHQKFNEADSTFITDKGDPFVVGQGLFIAANLPVSAVRYVDWYLNTNPVLQRLEQGEYNGDLLSQYHKKIQRMNPGAVEEPSGEFYKSVGVIDGQMSNGESPYGNGNERPLPAVPQNLALSNPAPPAFPIYRREGWTSVQRYEWTYALQNHAWKGAKPFKDFIDGMWAARGDTFTAPNYSGPNHARYAQVRAFMDANVDVDTALTALALFQWMGPWDDSTQNHFLWRRANGKFIHLPWDFDGMFDGGSEGNKRTYSIYVGENGNPSNNFRGPNWFKDTFLKTYRTEYNQRMWELANSFLDPANVSALGFNSIVSFATARRTNVNSQLASLGTYFKPARPTNQQPANLSTVLPPADFVTSPYAHSNATNPSPHTTTKWEIRPSTGSYADPAFVLTSTTELTTLAIPFDQLVYGQTYFWRVTYFDADGHPSVVSAETRFNFGNSSPTAGSVVINEVLANNRKAVVNGGRFPDYIELKNTTNAPIDLAGWALSDDPLLTSKFLFPPGTTIAANGYLLVWCDNDILAPGLHTGFALDSSGQTITLTQSGAIRDSVTFGPQAPDLSIGRSPDGTGGFALNEVTPEATNALKTPLGSVNNLHINEWVADANGEDWFELYNADSAPVQIGNLYLSDTSALPTLTRIPALSFIAGKGFVDFIADGSTAGANHCDFRLSTAGDTIILTAANGITTVALATFGAQLTDVSEGRLPDGAAQVVKFPNSATRRGANYLPAPVVINEALTASTAPLEDAVEIFNPSESTVDLSGWWLSDDTTNLQKYQIPAGTMIGPGEFKVFHEYLFNPTPGIGNSFSLSALGDELILSAVDGTGALTGYRSQLRFGGAVDGVSFGRVVTSVGSDFFPQISRTFGEVTDFRSALGAPNSGPRAGPIVISEVMYHPPDGADGSDNPQDEYIELQNITGAPVDISGWILQDGVAFTFPAETTIAPGAVCLVVNFDPADPAALLAFRNRYAIDPARPIFGPYTPRLANSSANVELAQPGPLLAGETPLIVVDHVVYDDSAAWPVAADGAGSSLNRVRPGGFGNDPINWIARVPSPGTGAPLVRTLAATNIDAISAQLNAEAFPSGTAAVLEFVIPPTRYNGGEVPAEGGPIALGQLVTGLSPHTSYSYRAEVTSALGVTLGEDIVFTTLNRLPEAAAKEFHPTLPGPFEFDVLASDSDPDGDQLTILSVTQGEHGTVTTDGTSITYTPAPDYAGTDLFTYTISDGFGGETSTTVTLRNAGADAVTDMIATNGEVVSFDPRANDTDADDDPLTISGVTQGAAGTVTFSATNVTYTPGPAFLGRDSFTYTITDGTVSAIGTVLVRNTAPITVVGAVTGTQVPGEAPGTVYDTIGLPTRGLFAGTLQTSGHARLRAVFGANGEVILKSGAAAPGVVGATIANLRDLSGQAIIATLRGGGVKRSDDTALYVQLPDGSVQLAAREGGTLTPGLTLEKILSVDGNGPTVFFTAKVGGPAVGKNDVVLCGIVPGAQPQILVREGHLVGSRPVSVVGTLIGARGTLAEGRWRTGPAEIGVRLTFPGNFHALYAIPATATSPDDWAAWAKTGDELPGQGHIQSFGLPGFSSDAVSYAAELVEAPLGKAKHSKNIVLARTSATGSVVLATQSGPVPGVDAAPIPGLKFKKFADPIGGANETTAFGATLSGSGVNATNRTGLWFAGSDNKVRMIARAGDSAAGGGRWSAFRSLVLPDGAGAGPVFTASLAVRGFDAVTRQSNEGMWAFDSAGTMRLLVRTGQTLLVNGTPRSIKRFVALSPVFATPNGSAVGFDDDGHVTATAMLNDGSHALLHIVIP